MSDQQIKLFVTADYELFHGRNFVSDEAVLFGPTRDLLSLCDALDVPLTLFADVCCVWAHQAAGLHDFVAQFEDQLKAAVRGGHDVQLHLHPHWLVARHAVGGWELTDNKIHLSEFGFDDQAPTGTPSIVRRGCTYLTDLLVPERADYRCRAFRAGGLALQPGERALLQCLETAGIDIDSSIAKGLTLDLDTISIDYRHLSDDANWWIGQEQGLRGGGRGGLYEIPVVTFKSGLRSRVGFLWRRARALSMRRGSGISRSKKQTRLANVKTLALENLRYLGPSPFFLLSADTKGFDTKMLLDGLDAYVAEHRASPVIRASMLNHPKLMFPQQLALFREFVEGARARYGSRLSFEAYGAFEPPTT